MKPQVSSQSDRNQVRDQLDRELRAQVTRLQQSHDNLLDEYDEEALRDLTNNMYEVGTRLNHMLGDLDDLYYDWMNKSPLCRGLGQEIVEKADEAASAFQSAKRQGYNPIYCKRRVQNVMLAIKNLIKINSKR